jgi:hypothetical protein
MTLLLAGHETTALALTWAFHLLATHPEVEWALHAELDRVLAGRLPSAEDIEALTVTRGVVGESLRLYPPAWVIGRKVLEPLPLTDGPVLTAGTIAVLCPWVLHRDARFWPEPERVDPERWTAEARAARHRHAFLGFGAGTGRASVRPSPGPRRCWCWPRSQPGAVPMCPGPVVRAQRHLRPRGGLPVTWSSGTRARNEVSGTAPAHRPPRPAAPSRGEHLRSVYSPACTADD